jgi:cyanophycinase
VLIPTGSQNAESPTVINDFLEPWRKYSPQSLVVLHARNRCQANDPNFLKPLREATGVWISGGVQSRLADRYVGTEVETKLRRLLSRNGIVAGTSAGAAVMTRVMIADGYRQPVVASGLDLLNDAIVDQHFSQRYRMIRLAKAIQMNPNRFGVGVDEGTGLLIFQNRGRVLGQGQVRFIAAAPRRVPSKPSLMVCDYASGEEVNLELWREAAAQAGPITQAEFSCRRRARAMQSRIAPSLTYSLSYEPKALDFCR